VVIQKRIGATSSALQGRLRRAGAIESRELNVRLYREVFVCYSYSETVIIIMLETVASIRLVKTEKTCPVLVICKLCE
jgi:hypothetical protein